MLHRRAARAGAGQEQDQVHRAEQLGLRQPHQPARAYTTTATTAAPPRGRPRPPPRRGSHGRWHRLVHHLHPAPFPSPGLRLCLTLAPCDRRRRPAAMLPVRPPRVTIVQVLRLEENGLRSLSNIAPQARRAEPPHHRTPRQAGRQAHTVQLSAGVPLPPPARGRHCWTLSAGRGRLVYETSPYAAA